MANFILILKNVWMKIKTMLGIKVELKLEALPEKALGVDETPKAKPIPIKRRLKSSKKKPAKKG